MWFPTHPVGVHKYSYAILTNSSINISSGSLYFTYGNIFFRENATFLQIFCETWHSQVIWYKYISNVVYTFHQGFQILLHIKNTSRIEKKKQI